MATQIQLRRDTAANWTAADPVLANGEPAVETDTGKFKLGDGVTAWIALDYFAPGVGVLEAGVSVLASAVALNFVSGATVADAGSGVVDVTIAGGGGGGPEVVFGGGSGTETVTQTGGVGGVSWGNLAFGRVYAYDTATADIEVTGKGALAFGSVDVGGDDIHEIKSGGDGSLAFGRVGGYADPGLIQATGRGGFAGGHAYNGGVIDSSFHPGAMSFGEARLKGSRIAAGEGAQAFGYAEGHTAKAAGAMAIEAPYKGAHAHGHVASQYGNLSTAKIRGANEGATAFGYVRDGGAASNTKIEATGKGAFAGGFANPGSNATNTGSVVEATASGSFAFGQAISTTATQARIRATGAGSFALGRASAADIVASGVNSVQLGHGTNAQADSISVAGGVRINGVIPAAPRNGDIWVDAGVVKIQSGGVAVTIA